ncbi:hypothetical protein [Rhodopirellula bahusiensis]|uniref:hypothetical protein n=1 Tax=Rhodopirellula bahusiensis TaxID=2014065 RepID=UPI0032643A99
MSTSSIPHRRIKPKQASTGQNVSQQLSRMLASLVTFINQSDRQMIKSGVVAPIAERVPVVATRRH